MRFSFFDVIQSNLRLFAVWNVRCGVRVILIYKQRIDDLRSWMSQPLKIS